MATQPGTEDKGVLFANGDATPYPADSAKEHLVAWAGYAALLGSGPPRFKMRARDTGASFVMWIASDPTQAYPGVPVGVIVDKQIAATI